jgi:carboxyl-terminal processing protease
MVALGGTSGVIILSRGTRRAFTSVPSFDRLIRIAALVSLLATVACTPNSGGSTLGNRIVTPAPVAKPTGRQPAPNPASTPNAVAPAAAPTPGTPTQLRGHGLSSTDLYTAYRAIIDTYVDPVDDTQLVTAATYALRQQLQDQPTLPLFTMPLDLIGGLTGNPDQDWQAFGDAYDSLVTKMPDWAQRTHPDWVVLRAMADSLHDGHTSFMTPDEAERSHETSFAGIGVLMSRPQDSQPPLIAEIFPNSPAASSGLKRGDRIIGVDGQDVTGQSVGDIATLIRGQPGTNVKVEITRLNQSQPLDFTMQRAVVQVDQVVGRQVPNVPVGYMKIRSFSDPSMVDEVLGILDQGRQRGIKGWVIDLRGNPGGALNAVLGAAAGFVDANHAIIGYQVDRQRRQTPLQTQPLNLLNGSKLVVLVDHDSASGAEIFAAALHEAQIATLVGNKTAGNVGVATQITLPDDSALQVTEERFVSPSGAALDGVGVTPDVQVDLTDDDLENDRDPQLGKALEVLVQQISAPAAGTPAG